MAEKIPDDIKNKYIIEEDDEDVTWLLTHVTTVTRDELSHFWWHLEPVTDYGLPSSCLCHAGWENYESTESENHDHCPGLSLAAVSSNNTSSSDKTKLNMKIFLVFILTSVLTASPNSILRNYSRQVNIHFVFREKD